MIFATLFSLVIDILEKLVKSRQTLSKAMVARNGFSQVIDSPYGRLAWIEEEEPTFILNSGFH